MNLDLNKTNPNELYQQALKFEKLRDYNSSIKCFHKAALAGSVMAYIVLAHYIKYPVNGYKLDDVAKSIVDPSNFSKYLDDSVALGSNDAIFFKAREQFIGDGFIPFDFNEALNAFKYLKTLDYDPYDTFSDDWTIDDYIDRVNRTINHYANRKSKHKCYGAIS